MSLAAHGTLACVLLTTLVVSVLVLAVMEDRRPK